MTTILCFGDSNTWGFDPAGGGRFPPERRWPGVMRGRLPAGWQVIEEGLCGRTALYEDPFEEGRSGLAYLTPCLDTHEPVDLVVLMLGTNDVKGIFPHDAAGIAAGLNRLVSVIRRSRRGPGQAAPQVLLVAPAPVAAPPAPMPQVWGFSEESVRRSRELAGFCRAVAEGQSCAFLDAGALVQVSPLDGVHLDAAAHETLGTAVAARVRELLGPARG